MSVASREGAPITWIQYWEERAVGEIGRVLRNPCSQLDTRLLHADPDMIPLQHAFKGRAVASLVGLLIDPEKRGEESDGEEDGWLEIDAVAWRRPGPVRRPQYALALWASAGPPRSDASVPSAAVEQQAAGADVGPTP